MSKHLAVIDDGGWKRSRGLCGGLCFGGMPLAHLIEQRKRKEEFRILIKDATRLWERRASLLTVAKVETLEPDREIRMHWRVERLVLFERFELRDGGRD